MTGMLLEALLILVLIAANGIFALSEIAVVTARKTRLQSRADEGDARAGRALELANHPNRFLSTVQVGITLVGIFAGAYGGATIARELQEPLGGLPLVGPYREQLALALVVIAITYLTLVLGELVPKRIALNAPERIAAMIARPMQVLAVVAAPVVKLLSLSTEAVLHLLRVRKRGEQPVTEEEITAMLEQGAKAGAFEPDEPKLVERVFWLADLEIGAVMTQRSDIVWLDLREPVDAQRETMAAHRFSRFLVCDGELDRVVGMVDVKDLWARALREEPLDLRASMTHPLFVTAEVPALQVLNRFRESGVHLALVRDERGAVRGLATLNDVLEEITGELELDKDPGLVQRPDGSWLADGSLDVDALAGAVGLDAKMRRELSHHRTVAAVVVASIGRIPHVGESVEAAGLGFEVVDMDGPRIDKVLVRGHRQV